MSKYKILYQNCISHPEDTQHLCTQDQITGIGEKILDTLDEAIEFLFECSFPITNIKDFNIPGLTDEKASEIHKILSATESERMEQLLSSQKPLYVFTEEDSVESYLPKEPDEYETE